MYVCMYVYIYIYIHTYIHIYVCSCPKTVEHILGDRTLTPTDVLLSTLRPRVLKSLLQLSSLCDCLLRVVRKKRITDTGVSTKSDCAVCVCVCAYIYIYMHICVYIYIYTSVPIHIYIYIYIYAYM